MLGVLGLHYYTLEMTCIIKLLSAQKEAKQDVHEEHDDEVFADLAARPLVALVVVVVRMVLAIDVVVSHAPLDVVLPLLLRLLLDSLLLFVRNINRPLLDEYFLFSQGHSPCHTTIEIILSSFKVIIRSWNIKHLVLI